MRRKRLTADVWFVHDPQVLPLARFLPRGVDQTWIWAIHIDLTTPNKDTLDTLMPFTRDYDRLIFSLDSYVPEGLDKSQSVSIAPPAIDPLTVKNTPMDRQAAVKLVSAMGIDPARPMALQVSRFDIWKDPWGVIDAFRQARREIPGLQLALLGLTQANDDPEAVEIVANVASYAEQDPDIHLYFDPAGLPAGNDDIVNAFQVAADVVLQKSLREGFGLTVSEAMWKGQPVIGGNVGGIQAADKGRRQRIFGRLAGAGRPPHGPVGARPRRCGTAWARRPARPCGSGSSCPAWPSTTCGLSGPTSSGPPPPFPEPHRGRRRPATAWPDSRRQLHPRRFHPSRICRSQMGYDVYHACACSCYHC